MERLNSSPRHGEWATVSRSGTDSIRAWVVYPERKTKAPVVIVIHEIFGLSTWVRAVADQLAADGFIAIAPDLLTMKPRAAGSDTLTQQEATAAIRTLDPTWVQQQIDNTAKYAMALPAAQPRYGIVGYCWGGGISFAHATHSPSLGASVVYYGVSPPGELLSSVRGSCTRLVRRKRRKGECDDPASRFSDARVGKDLCASHLRWRGTWVLAPAVRRERRQHCRHSAGLAGNNCLVQALSRRIDRDGEGLFSGDLRRRSWSRCLLDASRRRAVTKATQYRGVASSNSEAAVSILQRTSRLGFWDCARGYRLHPCY